jgi:hypothetical protein
VWLGAAIASLSVEERLDGFSEGIHGMEITYRARSRGRQSLRVQR